VHDETAAHPDDEDSQPGESGFLFMTILL